MRVRVCVCGVIVLVVWVNGVDRMKMCALAGIALQRRQRKTYST